MNPNKKLMGEPKPRECPSNPIGVNNLDSKILTLLDIPIERKSANVFEVLVTRQTRREFCKLEVGVLAEFLWYTAKTARIQRRIPPPDWEHRPFPSAGGCHATQILVISPSHGADYCGFYDHCAHGLRPIEVEDVLATVRDQISEVLPIQDGTLIFLAADPSRISGYYTNWESLVWRDAGVLIGGFSVVAEALDLNFCPLGVSGSEQIGLMLEGTTYLGVGVCILGGRRST
ncbi:MAG: hypothetical protein H7Y36_12325 [Armatimonadetes bacterium]|nr:hypothetical protein [Akkermansiaceae bacterium]